MRNRTKTAIAAFAITGLAVAGTDAVTYAGTGDSLILGKFNRAGKTTHLTSTGSGPALSLHAKGKRPALAVDSNAKVVRLNADRVDGHDAAGLQNNVRVFTNTSAEAPDGHLDLALPSFPKGRYQATYSVFMSGAYGNTTDPLSARCYLREVGNNPRYAGQSETLAEFMPPGLSASDILTKDSDGWILRCSNYQNSHGGIRWSVHPAYPVRVTLTRIDKTIGGSLDATRSRPGADARTPH